MKASDLRKLYLSVIHLYGFVTSKDLFAILKHYKVDFKKEQILNDLQKRTSINSNSYFVQRMRSNSYLIIDPLYDNEHFQVLCGQKEGKPVYYPKTFEDLLKYSDILYRDDEEQKCYNDLYRFLKRHLHEDEMRIESLASIIIYTLKDSLGNGINEVSAILDMFNYQFEDQSALEKFVSILQKTNNNLRMPSNNGYTPNELRKLYGPTDFNNTVLTMGPNMKKNFLDGVNDPYEYLKALEDMDLPTSIKESFKQELLDVITESKKIPKA